MSVSCTPLSLSGVLLFESKLFRDDRGWFQELYNRAAFHEAGLTTDWVQDNMSLSARNVVRGLHYQTGRPQAKLVRVLRGAVLDVVVDIRRSSPTFGQHLPVPLQEGDGMALLVPVGFAHGFAALEDNTIMLYKVSDVHYPPGECTLLWNDPALNINWPVAEADAVLSGKDAAGKTLKDTPLYD